MPTLRLYRILPLILLLTLAVACAHQAAPSLPATASTGYEPTPLPVIQPADPAETSAPKPAHKSGAPANIPGSDASQIISFDVPSHPFDVIPGRPTANSITLSMLSATNQTVSIACGMENSTPQTISASLRANSPQEITLSNLRPDSEYFYEVIPVSADGTVSNGEKNSFHTARAPGSTFTFTIQADSHLDSNSSLPVYEQTLANERADQPDFVIDLGDTFMTDKVKPYTAAEPQYWAQRYYFSLLNTPLFLVLGNHDGEGAPKGSGGQEMSTWSARLRTQLFPNPVPDAFYTGNSTPGETVGALQDYYAWEWGDALYIVLDPYWYTPPLRNDSSLWTNTLGETQYKWLKSTLETSQAKWKFVFIHQLIGGYDKNGRGGVEVAKLYEWGGNNADGSYGFDKQRPGWGLPIHQLLVQNHVNAVFHGHDHLFIKQELDGIIYQEVPQPSASRANTTDSAAEYGYLSGDVLGSPGHLRVTVGPQQVTVEYVRSYLPQDEKSGQKNGQVDYSYTIVP
jgi:predicted phosphodiesterase